MVASLVPDRPTAQSPRWHPAAPPSPHHAENAAIVARHLAGDPRAFTELMQRYRGRLIAFIYRIIGDRERAEDLVQEAFIRVHRHLHRFDPSKKFSTWIYTIASNLAKNELRNRSRSPLVLYQSARPAGEEDQRPLQFPDEHSRPDEMYQDRHLQRLVEEAVAKLSDTHRVVFVMRELEGRSYEEIAARTGTNLGTVKSRLNRARAAFAGFIAPYLD